MEVTLEQELLWAKADLKKAEEKLEQYLEKISDYRYGVSMANDDIEDYKYQIAELERQIQAQREVD